MKIARAMPLLMTVPLVVLSLRLAAVAAPNAPESYWVARNFALGSTQGPQGYCIPGGQFQNKSTFIAIEMPMVEWQGLLDLAVAATFEIYRWSASTQSYYLYVPAHIGRHFQGSSHQGSPSFSYLVGYEVINGQHYAYIGGQPRAQMFYAPVEPGYYFVRLVLNVSGIVSAYYIPFTGPGSTGYWYCNGLVALQSEQAPPTAVIALPDGTTVDPPPAYNGVYLPLVRQSGGAAPTPTPTPPSPTLPPPSAPPTTSGLGDPGFESGPGGAWNETSAQGYNLIMTGTVGYAPRSGTWMAWLGGAHNELSTLSRSVTVPATHPFLSLYLWATSTEEACVYDGLTVYANEYSLGKLGLCQASATSAWQQRYLDLRAFAGQTITLTFQMWTDESLLSSIFLDDLSFVSGLHPMAPIRNPGFELGDNGDWTTYSQLGYDTMFTSTSAHAGSWLAWLGGAHNEVSYLQQALHVPTGQPYLTYWGWLASVETDCSLDRVHLLVNGTSLPGYGLCTQTNTGGWGQGWINLSAYAGQVVTLQLRVTTNGSALSSLYLDDFAFAATAPGAAAAQHPPPLALAGPIGAPPGPDSKPASR